MELIERKFYTKAKMSTIIEEINATQEEREEESEEIIAFLRMMEEDQEQNPPKADPEKVAWFEGMQESVIEFAKNCDLDMRMYIDEQFDGHIEFQTCYFELTAWDDRVIRRFWLYLCQRGELKIIDKVNDVFSIEFRFKLSE